MFHFPVFVGLIPLKNRSSRYWLPLSGFKVPRAKETKIDSVPELWQQGEAEPLLPEETGAKIQWKGKQTWQQKTEIGYVITEPCFHTGHPPHLSSWCGLSRTVGCTGTAQIFCGGAGLVPMASLLICHILQPESHWAGSQQSPAALQQKVSRCSSTPGRGAWAPQQLQLHLMEYTFRFVCV